MKNPRDIAREIVERTVKAAGNGNGYRLTHNGREIAWCAGALHDGSDPHKAVRELTDFVEMVLLIGINNVVGALALEARGQTERCVELRSQADEADRKAADLGKAIDLVNAVLKKGEP